VGPQRFLFAPPLAWHKILAWAEREEEFVKWALRNVGKRNPCLNRAAIAAAQEIRQLDSRAARWIASNAIRELESEAVQKRLKSKR
jgi:3-methyladenine DNA glycosylase AlkD